MPYQTVLKVQASVVMGPTPDHPVHVGSWTLLSYGLVVSYHYVILGQLVPLHTVLQQQQGGLDHGVSECIEDEVTHESYIDGIVPCRLHVPTSPNVNITIAADQEAVLDVRIALPNMLALNGQNSASAVPETRAESARRMFDDDHRHRGCDVDEAEGWPAAPGCPVQELVGSEVAPIPGFSWGEVRAVFEHVVGEMEDEDGNDDQDQQHSHDGDEDFYEFLVLDQAEILLFGVAFLGFPKFGYK